MRGYNIWTCLVLSILVVGLSLYKILTNSEGWAWGIPYPAWASWIELPAGLGMGFFVIRGLLRGEGKKRKVTDEELATAKAELERLHIMEHGTLPEYPPDIPEMSADEKK